MAQTWTKLRACHRLSGVVAEQALAAAGQLAGHCRDIGVLAITSADRLNAGWTAAQQERTDGHKQATSHIEKLLAEVPRHALLLTVIDGHPATLSWIGGVKGMGTLSHGVEHFWANWHYRRSVSAFSAGHALTGRGRSA